MFLAGTSSGGIASYSRRYLFNELILVTWRDLMYNYTGRIKGAKRPIIMLYSRVIIL